MNEQSYLPSSSTPFGSGDNNTGRAFALHTTTILVIVFGIGTALFGFLTIKYYSQASSAAKTLNTQVSAGIKAGATAQKKIDDHNAVVAGESPFRAFDAPDIYGSFVINFPKDWASWVDEESSGTQVTLILNPNFVTKTGGVNGLAATIITLQETNGNQYISRYGGSVKSGLMQQSSTTVSGQPATTFTGKFPNHRTVREVVVPVRDKVLVFDNENAQYATEFDEILAQAKVVP